MRTKVAIFGSEEFCQRALQFTEQRSDIILDLYPYTIPSEAPDLLKKLLPCDAILFSGSLPYVASTDVLQSIPVPAIYLKQDETEITTTLLAISIHHSLELEKMSIDVRDCSVLENVLADIKADEQRPLTYQLEKNYVLEEVVQFHASAYANSPSNVAVTSVHAVYDRLTEQGIPVFKMISVKSSFLKTIDRVCQEALLQKSETSKIAAGILDNSILTTEVKDIYKRLAQVLHAHCIHSEEGFLFYTTQGAIQSALHTPLFQQLAVQVSGQLAFGSGRTLTAAKENAVSALRYMQTEHNAGPYLLDEKKELHNLIQTNGSAIELRVIEPILTEIAEKTALSPAVLSKLVTFGQSQQSTQFTANDLASHLGVSRRTAERTIKKLLTSEYVNTVGEEMTYRQGRPRAVYELNFPVY
ncbi:HTH domain-containing protein [Sporosarcina sp. BI001-red]|uniref:HTH domain-containing protein n=1 Tax=Sporosarcina sp. BI001-red TaxID=2282866 RepID=UPI000E28030E|nr:HTH domain-containing protein [Sporosarcina sp. BI001-red]REB06436.1 HTH domain-containing protein [Sporosarcina sp. BI001-red]